MVKRRETNVGLSERTSTTMSKKHHKKHKKHKKKKCISYDSIDDVDIISDVSPYKMEIPSTSTTTINLGEPAIASITTSNCKPQQKKRKTKAKDSGTSSDEERWLDAIESGKLEEVDDELKKIKDPKLMTARQRAMYERSTTTDKELNSGGEILISLPTGYKEKVMTAEAIQKAQLKSQKRKQLADEKREKDKKKTMERLLKKQDSTKIGKQVKSKIIKSSYPVITYINNIHGAKIIYPAQYDIPMKPQLPKDPPKIILCSNPECTNKKVYNCSKTNLPLCNFACYKKNITLNEIIC